MMFTLDVHADLRISLVRLGRPRGLRRWLLGAHACKVEDLVWCTSPLLRRLSAALLCGLDCCDEYKVVGELATDKIKILRLSPPRFLISRRGYGRYEEWPCFYIQHKEGFSWFIQPED
ncbi:hypothetical protein VPH35_067021 [Triticum aestivum]